jgi:hypothetical protein
MKTLGFQRLVLLQGLIEKKRGTVQGTVQGIVASRRNI